MQAITYLITQVTESVRATLDVEGPGPFLNCIRVRFNLSPLAFVHGEN